MEDQVVRLDKIILVIGRVPRDSCEQRSRGKVLFNGIDRPSTMLIPLATRSLLCRSGHWLARYVTRSHANDPNKAPDISDRPDRFGGMWTGCADRFTTGSYEKIDLISAVDRYIWHEKQGRVCVT